MSYEKNGGDDDPGVLDNSTHWLDVDPETGQPDLSSVHSVHDYIGEDGTHYTLDDDGNPVVTIPGPNDD